MDDRYHLFFNITISKNLNYPQDYSFFEFFKDPILAYLYNDLLLYIVLFLYGLCVYLLENTAKVYIRYISLRLNSVFLFKQYYRILDYIIRFFKYKFLSSFFILKNIYLFFRKKKYIKYFFNLDNYLFNVRLKNKKFNIFYIKWKKFYKNRFSLLNFFYFYYNDYIKKNNILNFLLIICFNFYTYIVKFLKIYFINVNILTTRKEYKSHNTGMSFIYYLIDILKIFYSLCVKYYKFIFICIYFIIIIISFYCFLNNSQYNFDFYISFIFFMIFFLYFFLFSAKVNIWFFFHILIQFLLFIYNLFYKIINYIYLLLYNMYSFIIFFKIELILFIFKIILYLGGFYFLCFFIFEYNLLYYFFKYLIYLFPIFLSYLYIFCKFLFFSNLLYYFYYGLVLITKPFFRLLKKFLSKRLSLGGVKFKGYMYFFFNFSKYFFYIYYLIIGYIFFLYYFLTIYEVVFIITDNPITIYWIIYFWFHFRLWWFIGFSLGYYVLTETEWLAWIYKHIWMKYLPTFIWGRKKPVPLREVRYKRFYTHYFKAVPTDLKLWDFDLGEDWVRTTMMIRKCKMNSLLSFFKNEKRSLFNLLFTHNFLLFNYIKLINLKPPVSIMYLFYLRVLDDYFNILILFYNYLLLKYTIFIYKKRLFYLKGYKYLKNFVLFKYFIIQSYYFNLVTLDRQKGLITKIFIHKLLQYSNIKKSFKKQNKIFFKNIHLNYIFTVNKYFFIWIFILFFNYYKNKEYLFITKDYKKLQILNNFFIFNKFIKNYYNILYYFYISMNRLRYFRGIFFFNFYFFKWFYRIKEISIRKIGIINRYRFYKTKKSYKKFLYSIFNIQNFLAYFKKNHKTFIRKRWDPNEVVIRKTRRNKRRLDEVLLYKSYFFSKRNHYKTLYNKTLNQRKYRKFLL